MNNAPFIEELVKDKAIDVKSVPTAAELAKAIATATIKPPTEPFYFIDSLTEKLISPSPSRAWMYGSPANHTFLYIPKPASAMEKGE